MRNVKIYESIVFSVCFPLSIILRNYAEKIFHTAGVKGEQTFGGFLQFDFSLIVTITLSLCLFTICQILYHRKKR